MDLLEEQDAENFVDSEVDDEEVDYEECGVPGAASL